ncbi:hypothetical protein PV326_012900 [Microctonus aethiopoides]|nr:hypothetical protein PV326_012900 [Microctonus aethiopoides]
MFSSYEFFNDLFPYSVKKCENKLCPCDTKSSKSSENESTLSIEENEENESNEFFINYHEELTKKPTKKLSLWETILKESEEKFAPLYEWQRQNNESVSERELEHDNNPVQYLNDKIFPILLSTMEQMLIEACQQNALEFNGLDYLAEHLWNKNPQHPERSNNWLKLFDIPPFKLWLREHPRPIYPKSWRWTKEQAALRIQRYVRGWIVRKRDDVQELRQFWKALAKEKKINTAFIQSSDESLVQCDKLTSEIMKKLSICERYKLLIKLKTN